jgi:hypothetical protein
VTHIEWLRENGRVDTTGYGGPMFLLDSPVKRKLDAEEKLLKRRAIRWLRQHGAMYDSVGEKWLLSSLGSPNEYKLIAGGSL